MAKRRRRHMIQSLHHGGSLTAGENRKAAKVAQVRTRAWRVRYQLVMLARKEDNGH